MDIATFARSVLGKPLYPYQLEVAEAILESIEGGHGRIFTVMMARQAGKNQLSAVLEAYLLSTRSEGTIVKAAPTFHPQIRTSYERLSRLLYASELRERLWSNASIIGLSPTAGPEREKKQAGPRVLFYSASPESNVVGSTAELLLEIDEAQDVEFEKFNRDFRPMAATRNATTVLYGTAWSDTTLLAMQRSTNLSAEERGSARLHFEFDWQRVAEFNAEYRVFVEQEIERLGKDHPLIQTQYCLRSIDGAGYLLKALQRILLQGSHAWQEAPDEDGGWYVAGMDVGGEERPDPNALSSSVVFPTRSRGRHDSSVFTLGRVHYNELNVACVEIVHQCCWTGRTHMEQYSAVQELMDYWRVRSLVIDATGLGEGLASLLVDRFGAERVHAFRFTQQSKSHLTYQFLSLINAGRLKMPAQASMPASIYESCWHQLRQARYRLPAPDLMTMEVNPADGHDDFLISVALLGETLHDLIPPVYSATIRPRPLYPDGGRY
jgi:hypothetical protein